MLTARERATVAGWVGVAGGGGGQAKLAREGKRQTDGRSRLVGWWVVVIIRIEAKMQDRGVNPRVDPDRGKLLTG